MQPHVQHLQRPDRAARRARPAASGARRSCNDFRTYIGQLLGGEAQGRVDRLADREPAARRLNAPHGRQAPAVPGHSARTIRRSCPVEVRITRVPRDLRAVRCDRRRAAGRALPRLRQSVLRVEVPGAQLHPQLAEADRARATCSRRRSCRTRPTRCRRCAAASVRRTGCARAPARSTTASAR